MSSDLDRLIHEKRLQLKDALATHQQAREALTRARQNPPAEIQHLEVAAREAADRFNALSKDLAHLHRSKFGEWRFPWQGPTPPPANPPKK